MKRQVRVSIEEKVLERLQQEASSLGMDLTTYIQLVLGQHVKHLEK